MLAAHDNFFNVPFLTSTAATRPTHPRNILQPGIPPGFQPMKNKTGPKSHKGSSNNIQRKKPRLESTTFDEDDIPTRGLMLTPVQQKYLVGLAADSANVNNKNQKNWTKILNLFQSKFPHVNIQNTRQLKNHCSYIMKLSSQLSTLTATSSSVIGNMATVEKVTTEIYNEFINSNSSSDVNSADASSSSAVTNLEEPASSDINQIFPISSNMNSNRSNMTTSNANTNNTTYSSEDLATVQLQTAPKGLIFSDVEKAIYNSLLASYGSSGSISWSNFQNAFIEKCKTAKLNDSQSIVYLRTTNQLKERYKTIKDKHKQATAKASDKSKIIDQYFKN